MNPYVGHKWIQCDFSVMFDGGNIVPPAPVAAPPWHSELFRGDMQFFRRPFVIEKLNRFSAHAVVPTAPPIGSWNRAALEDLADLFQIEDNPRHDEKNAFLK